MDRSVVILSLGDSKGFDQDKGTILVDGKPLLTRVVDSVKGLADEVLVVVSSQKQADSYQKLVSPKVRFVVCDDTTKGSLGYALCGLEAADGNYSLLLPFDSPFISTEVAALLFDLSIGKPAVVPRSPDCEAEALHSVYNTVDAIKVAKEAMAEGDFEAEALVERLRCIRFISTMVIEQLDPDLKTFFRIITPVDLKRAAVLSKPKPRRSKSKTK